MAAAAELFGERGFDGVRVDQIARRAGVNKAMISYHFGGKQGLYTAILEDLFAAINAELEVLRGSPGTADQLLRNFLGIIAAHSQRHPGFPAMLLREVMSGGPHIPDSMLPRFLAVFQAVRGIVERGVREGTFRPVDPILTHLTVLGSLMFFFATNPMRVRMHRAGKLPPGVELPTPESFVVHIQELMARGLSAEPPRGPSRRSRALGAAVLALPVLMFASCRGGNDAGLIRASGHVEATEVRVSTKVAGRLRSLAIREGDQVQPGQLLAEIDTTDLKLSLGQARAEREQTAAELRLRLAGARPEDVAELQAQVQSVKADLDGAERDLERMQGLLDKGSGTTKARDDARTRRDMAAARLEAMRQALARMKAGSRAEEIEAARARVAAMQARVALLEQQVQDATVTSPTAGVVTEKVAEAGELLQNGTVLCVVTDLAAPWLNVYVSEPDLARIRLGQEGEVATDDGQVRKGRVTFISAKAEFTPKNVQTRDERVKLVYRVKVGLDNADGLFKPGMPAEARLHAAAAVP